MVMISPSDPLGAFNELQKCKSRRDEWWAEMTAEEMVEQPYIRGASAPYCRPDVSKETRMVILIVHGGSAFSCQGNHALI